MPSVKRLSLHPISDTSERLRRYKTPSLRLRVVSRLCQLLLLLTSCTPSHEGKERHYGDRPIKALSLINIRNLSRDNLTTISNQFSGMNISLSGEVGSLGAGYDNTPEIRFLTGNRVPVIAMMDKEDGRKVALYAIDKTVSVICENIQFVDISIYLTGCAFAHDDTAE